MAAFKYLNFAVFDFETGGLSVTQNPVCEIGMVAVDGRSLSFTGEYEAIIAPYDDSLEYHPQALEVNRLTMEMIRGGKDLKLVVKELCDFLKKINTGGGNKWKPVLVGHNLSFDIPFLLDIFERCGKDLSQFVNGYKDKKGNFHPIILDTLQLSQLVYAHDENLTTHKLIDICRHNEVDLIDAHRAMADVKPTAEVLIKYLLKTRSIDSDGSDGPKRIKKTRVRDHFKY